MLLCSVLEPYFGFHFLQERAAWQVCSLEGGTQNTEGDDGRWPFAIGGCTVNPMKVKKDRWGAGAPMR